jgi:hypothetical protein
VQALVEITQEHEPPVLGGEYQGQAVGPTRHSGAQREHLFDERVVARFSGRGTALEGQLWKPVALGTIGDVIVEGTIGVGHDVTRLPDADQCVEQPAVVAFGSPCGEGIVSID